jgi:hypothetical protein
MLPERDGRVCGDAPGGVPPQPARLPDVKTSSRKQLAARFASIGALCLALALVTATPTVVEASQDGNWKDTDGNPLPFQSHEEIVAFLQTANIESVTAIPVGVTKPRQAVLESNGVRVHAAMRDYDEVFEEAKIGNAFYARLRDSFIFDVPAYELARLLDLDNIPPVAFRRYGGQRVTLQIWLEGGLMETDRVEQGLDPPSTQRYRQQTQNMRVFDSIIGNVDRNTGNILADADGTFWLIDHSRAFMRNDDTRYLERITSCGRNLFERIKALEREQLMEVISPPLTSSEVDWVLRRRDKVVAHIENLILTRGGEDIVLFDDSQ